jgi:hypothetical protein
LGMICMSVPNVIEISEQVTQDSVNAVLEDQRRSGLPGSHSEQATKTLGACYFTDPCSQPALGSG